MILLFGIVYALCISNVFTQGFIPDFRQIPLQRRQLTPNQQSHVFNDVQQHRFSLNQNQLFDQQQHQKNFGDKLRSNVYVEPSIQIQVPSQTTIINNQRSQSQQIRFPEQHHTQTNFVPNFAPQQQQQQQQQRNIPVPSSFRNQLPAQQQPINNRIQQFPSIQQPQTIHQRSVQNQQSFQHAQGSFEPSVRFPSTTSETFLAQQQQHSSQNIPPWLHNNFNNPNNFNVNTQQFQQQQQQQQQQPIRPSQPIPNDFIQSQAQQQFTSDFVNQQNQQQQQQQQQVPTQQTPFRNAKEEEQHIKELLEKQKLIQKHEQFVQKQYQKQQSKVKQLHDEFLEQQRRIKDESITNRDFQRSYSQDITRSRGLFPNEQLDFERAVLAYQKEHPTPPPTTTTTTEAITTTEETSIQQDLDNNGELTEELENLLRNNRQQLLRQLQDDEEIVSERVKPVRTKAKVKSTKALGRDDLLKQLKLALAEAPQDLGNKNYSSMDIVLPDGQKVQVIRTTDPDLIKNSQGGDSATILTQQLIANNKPSTATTQKQPEFNYEELTNGGILPPGSDFEVIKQTSDGKLQSIKDLPSQKKVTFVYLEEQDDGSYKVQGVKGNGDKEAKTKGTEVDSIIDRIKNGEIQLPPSNKRSILPSSTPPSLNHLQSDERSSNQKFSSNFENQQVPSSTLSVLPLSSSSSSSTSTESNVIQTTKYFTTRNRSPPTQRRTTSTPVTTASPHFEFRNSLSPYSTLATTTTTSTTTTTTPRPITKDSIRLTQNSNKYFQSNGIKSSSAAPIYQSNYETSTAASSTVSESTFLHDTPIRELVPPIFNTIRSNVVQSSNGISSTPSSISPLNSRIKPPVQNNPNELITILKSSGLHAMAKYLKQSGLDSILNETGPYTIFVPTDKAFKSLLVQLGGPERAEEKFKANPRLLSGLLLHHVIPGSFLITSLQDEMTGVSLAGTQLRVNQYHMDDVEWNDVIITTINGAMIVSDRQDVHIPQGIAHAIDRVMFPLPVGDLLQTLQSDRERRFTQFLRALYASGLSDLLQNKDSSATTYTLFAPIDAAFVNLTESDLNVMVSDKEASQKFVMKFITPNTLFSAGMRYYQIRDSLSAGHSITLQKTTTGKIKVNDAQIITSNIPSTNGVIHAIDSLL